MRVSIYRQIERALTVLPGAASYTTSVRTTTQQDVPSHCTISSSSASSPQSHLVTAPWAPLPLDFGVAAIVGGAATAFAREVLRRGVTLDLGGACVSVKADQLSRWAPK